MKSVTNWLEKRLRVQVNAAKTKVARPNQIKYLGHSFYFKDGKWRTKPHIKSLKKLEYKIVTGPYIHHCVGIHQDVVPVLYEACKYLGIRPDLYDSSDEEVERQIYAPNEKR